MKKRLLLSLLAALTLIPAGCASRQASGTSEEIVHGSAGVRFQSQDTSRVVHDRAPY